MSFKSRTAWWRIFCVNIPPLRETAPDLNFETSCKFWQIIDLRRGHAETHGKDDERWKKWSTVHWCMSVLNADFLNSHGPFWCPNVGLSHWYWCQIVGLTQFSYEPSLWDHCAFGLRRPRQVDMKATFWEGGLRHLIFDIRFPICTTGICTYPQKRFEPPLPTISIGILFGTSLEQSKTIQNLVETSWCTQLSGYIL